MPKIKNPEILQEWAKKNNAMLKIELDPTVEYRQSHINDNVMVGKDGTFYYIQPPAPKSCGVKKGTALYNKYGYPIMMEACFTKTDDNGKRIKVYNVGRLVLDAFDVPQTTDANGVLRDQVDHINQDPFDNRLENLRWATRSENMYNRNMKQLQASRNRCAKERGYKNWVDFLAKKRKAAMEEAGCETWGEFVASKHEGNKYRKTIDKSE